MSGVGCSTVRFWSRSTSRRNCWCVSASIHTAPNRARMSSIGLGGGITSRSACTFGAYRASCSLASIAASSFTRTLPLRYSAAGTRRCSSGSSNTSVPRRSRASLVVVPSSCAMASRSTPPVLSMLIVSASTAVSASCAKARCTTCRWVKIFAGEADWVASSKFSSAVTSAMFGSSRSNRATACGRLRRVPISRSVWPVSGSMTGIPLSGSMASRYFPVELTVYRLIGPYSRTYASYCTRNCARACVSSGVSPSCCVSRSNMRRSRAPSRSVSSREVSSCCVVGTANGTSRPPAATWKRSSSRLGYCSPSTSMTVPSSKSVRICSI